METIREDVDQEPADELVGRQPHDGSAIPTFDPVTLRTKLATTPISQSRAFGGDLMDFATGYEQFSEQVSHDIFLLVYRSGMASWSVASMY
jgi:hypothetical protein